jgi:molybdopterin converting factor small subunit
LGGVKKIVGQELIRITGPVVKVSYIVDLLRKNAAELARLNFDNLVIAVNGIDCSLLGGMDASVKEGDEVTVVTIVHGGGAAF